ncbi:MAG TPA: hypothetical protein VN441_09820 [Syntrophomonas sp.]|jgi:uncharacterized membrane protein HdeD (DUF308 family)|nr:hypothetical protein [Syntrophomonas sp.]
MDKLDILGTFEKLNTNNLNIFFLVLGFISIITSLYAFKNAKAKNNAKLEKDGRVMLLLGLCMVVCGVFFKY